MPAVDPDLDDAFAAVLEAVGESVTIGGTAYNAVVTAASLDQQFVEGGTAEAGGKSVVVSKDDLATAPAKLTTAVVRTQTLKVLQVFDRLRHWNIVVGNIDTR